jgi:hypothetical protein
MKKHSIASEIEAVERRIGMRRERAVRHFEELKTEAKRVARWWPIAAVAGSLVVGFAASRFTKMPAPAARMSMHAEPPRRASTARGILASVLALTATAMRVFNSYEARTFWNAFRSYRARRHAH